MAKVLASLHPVSIIEINNMATGQTISDAQAALTRAGVVKVEEQKKLAADYKKKFFTALKKRNSHSF